MSYGYELYISTLTHSHTFILIIHISRKHKLQTLHLLFLSVLCCSVWQLQAELLLSACLFCTGCVWNCCCSVVVDLDYLLLSVGAACSLLLWRDGSCGGVERPLENVLRDLFFAPTGFYCTLPYCSNGLTAVKVVTRSSQDVGSVRFKRSDSGNV